MPESPAQSNATTAEEWPEVEAFPEGIHQGGLLGEEYVASGKRAPLSNAERQARFVARRSDLGELPPPGDPERRARCSADVVAFAEEYCSALLDHAPSEGLRQYLRELQEAIEGAGQIHVRMARGAGKTTLVKCALAWALATGRLHYVVIFCAAVDLTAGILGDVWDVFEFCEAFAEDFPEVSVPIRAADGLSQRWLAQSYHGRRTQVRRSAREIRLPTIEGSPSSGAIVLGRGAGSKTRGLVRGKRRPDFVLLDDIQSREDALNPTAVRKLEEWIQGDIQGLTGSRMLNAVMTSTPIEPGDLSDRFADPDQHGEWRLVEHPLVESEPESPLWLEYDARWRAARLAGDSDFADATALYRANRAAMDKGAAVLDPLNFDARLELSGYQHARNLRLIMGRAAFSAEYQLTTRVREDAVQISPQLVAGRVNGSPRLALPPGTTAAVAFLDVNAAAGISWAVVAAGPHQTAAVVDWGRHPEGGRRLVPANASDDETDRLVSAGISAVLQRLLSLALPSAATGRAERVAAVWIDCGYRRRTVLRTAEVWRAKTGRLVFGCQGFANRNYQARSRHVEQRGRDADFRRAEGEAWFAQNSDLWRERAQRAFLAPPLTPGSLSLPGSDPREHLPYAEEVCAEILAEKIQRARGEPDLYLWTQRPGAGNHYLDATSGALCMAAWYRLLDDVDVFDAAGTAASETAARLRLRRVAPAGPRPDADPATPTAPLVTRRSSLVTYPTPPPRRAPLARVRSARMA